MTSRRRVGYYLRDKTTQTDESEILDLKRVTTAMQTLAQVTEPQLILILLIP